MTSVRRRFPFRHVVAGLGLAAIVAVVATMPEETPEDRTAGGTTAGAPAPPLAPAAETPGAVRMVSGPGILPLPAADTPPVRVAPPPRPAPPPKPIRLRRLMPVTMESTATFSAGEIRVRLPGVAVLEPEATCLDRAGVRWPCGRRALAGVRALVRGRAVDCPLPEGTRRGSFVVDCRLGEADLAERIVGIGWGRALDGESALGEIERRAEAEDLGLHAPTAWVEADPFPDPGEIPADRSTAPIDAPATMTAVAPPETNGGAAR